MIEAETLTKLSPHFKIYWWMKSHEENRDWLNMQITTRGHDWKYLDHPTGVKQMTRLKSWWGPFVTVSWLKQVLASSNLDRFARKQTGLFVRKTEQETDLPWTPRSWENTHICRQRQRLAKITTYFWNDCFLVFQAKLIFSSCLGLIGFIGYPPDI